MKQLGAALGLAFVLTIALPRAAAADSVLQTWQVGEEPAGLAVDPVDGRIFVANSKYPSTGPVGPGSISVINPSSGQRSVIVTSGPADFVALDPVHRRLYSSNADHSLQVFDLDTRSLIARLPVGGLGLVVDPLTQRVYVVDVNSAGSFLTVVDGSTNTIVQTKYAPSPESWWGLALDAGRHRLYVTNINAYPYSVPPIEPSLVVLDDRDLSLVADKPFPLITRFAIAIDDARDRIYLGGYDSTGQFANSRFYALEGSSLAVLASTSIPGFPGGIALVPTAHRIYVTSPGNGSGFGGGYRVLDDQTYEVIQTASTAPYDPFIPVLHPDGNIYMGGAWRSGPDVLMRIHVGNSAPVISSAVFSPATPTSSDVLRFVVSADDGDLPDLSFTRGPVTYSYEWSRNGVLLADATGTTLDLSQPATGDRGDTITAHVTVTDAEGLTATATASVLIPNAAPALTVAFDTTEPRTNDLLTAVVAAPDADGDPVTLIYEWYRNGARIAGASATTIDLATYGDKGDLIGVNVTASDDHGGVRQAMASTTIVDSPPVATVSLSNTSPTTNELLLATVTSTDADGDSPIFYTWQLLVNGVVVTGASPANYAWFDLALPNFGNRGDALVVRVQPWAYGQYIYGPTAEISAVVVNSAPSVAVSLNDTAPRVGDVLVASASGQDADGDAFTYTYTWRVNGLVKRTVTTTSMTDSFETAGRANPHGGDISVELVGTDGFTASAPATATATLRGSKQ